MKPKKLVLIFGSVLLLLSLFVYHNHKADAAGCTTNYCNTSYAWSSDIGFLNFAGTNYRVTTTPSGSNVVLGGYAWANPSDGNNEIGFLDFSAGGVTAPAAGGKVSGQATFKAADNTDWDGIVKFNCATCDVEYNANDGGYQTLTGYAWGAENVGFIHLDHTRVGTTGLSVTCSGAVTGPDGTGKYTITWTAAASGGSGTYTNYSWTGDNNLNDSGNPVQKKYSAGGPYNATVVVTDSSSNTAQGTCQASTGTSNQPPATPIFQQLSPGCNNIQVSWLPNPPEDNVTSYKLKRNGQLIYTDLPPFTYTFNDTGLTSGQTYTYTLTAQNANGSSPQATAQMTTSNSCQSSNVSTFKANPPVIPKGTACSLTWTVKDQNGLPTPDTCSISGGNGNFYDSNGVPFDFGNPSSGDTVSTDPINQSTTYTLSCPTVPVNKTTTCTIAPSYIEF